MTNAADTPKPPYYAVIFSAVRRPGDSGYRAMAERMVALASQQPGFLGVETARDATGLGITVSYWRTLNAIKNWKQQADHQEAQRLGRERWYREYKIRICKVESDHGFSADI